jgi:hypothetical protein
MANRHAHKKLRAEIRARMRVTGESYQRARARILRSGRVRAELTVAQHFGRPRTIATIEVYGVALNMVVPRLDARDTPLSTLRASLPRGVN